MTTAANDHQQSAAMDHAEPTTIADVFKLVQQASGTKRPSYPSALTKVQSGPTQQGRYIPTPSLDPAVITNGIKGVEAHIGYVQCAVEAFSECHVGLQRLSDAREHVKKDLSKTEANQILIVAAEAEKLQDRMTRKIDSASERLTQGIKALNESLSKPMTTAADNSISGEIRAYCRNLSDDKRGQFINDALKARDTVTLNAVLGARPYLSGLSSEAQAHHTRQFHELTNPEIAQRLKVMREALSVVQKNGPLVLKEIQKVVGTDWQTVQELQKASSAAAQALLLINNPVT